MFGSMVGRRNGMCRENSQSFNEMGETLGGRCANSGESLVICREQNVRNEEANC